MTRHNGFAVFSACGTYRYELGGDLGPEEPLFRTSDRMRQLILWMMLNPSTANAKKPDNTLDATVRFSERWGFGGILVGNLSAYVATFPKDLRAAAKAGVDIIGPDNDAAIARMVAKTRASGGMVMAAWGQNADPERARRAHAAIGEMYCLRTNQDGSPIHPLYQPSDLTPQIWNGV